MKSDIEIIEKVDHTKYTVEFFFSATLRMTSKGKHWPETVTCLIWQQKRLLGTGEVVCHPDDTPDMKKGMLLSAKKAFQQVGLWKELRIKFWDKILEYPSNPGKVITQPVIEAMLKARLKRK